MIKTLIRGTLYWREEHAGEQHTADWEGSKSDLNTTLRAIRMRLNCECCTPLIEEYDGTGKYIRKWQVLDNGSLGCWELKNYRRSVK